MKALIVDDSKAMRTIIRTILVKIGFETFEAADGVAALARLLEVGPTDVALVDWNMPEMNGFELVQKLRAQRTYDAMRIVMVTTEAEVDRMIWAMDAGANDYVMKPFTADVIREKMSLVGAAP